MERRAEMNGKAGKLRRILNRALAVTSMKFHVAVANRWRDSYNPLRGLTISRSVLHFEDGERGAFAELQWLYRFIEMQDATLGALVDRRTSAVQEMDWDVKIPEGLEGAELKLAKDQAKVLKDAYGAITNIKEAIEFMCMASFRGYSHLEVVEENGIITELAPVEQWHWVRDGINGEWQYNKDSRFGTNRGEDFDRLYVVREVARPINRVALVAFVRKSMSQKDWDGFIETYGIPAVFIIAPDDVPKDKEDEYQEVADQIASDARGVLPGGSDVKTVDNGARGVNPFLEHIKYQDEQVILRGTGGKLTMLAESGSGTLAGNAHKETFDQIARAEAAEISEIFKRVVDDSVLEKKFPGKPKLAYFEICSNEETDSREVVRDVALLKRSGYHVSDDQIREKTGYEVSTVESLHSSRPEGAPSPAVEENPKQDGPTDGTMVRNRKADVRSLLNKLPTDLLLKAPWNQSFVSDEDIFEIVAMRDLEKARRSDLQDLGDQLAKLLLEDDPDTLKAKLTELDSRLPETLVDDQSMEAWQAILATSLVNGLAGANEPPSA